MMFKLLQGVPIASRCIASTRLSPLCGWSLILGLILSLYAVLAAPAVAQDIEPGLTVRQTLLEPASGVTQVGETITVQTTLTNTGDTTIDILPLAISFDATTMEFTGASIADTPAPPDTQATGVISWTDLTLLSGVGNVAPGRSVNLRTRFTASAETRVGGSWDSADFSAPLHPVYTLDRLDANDVYDLETRFLIDNVIDPVYGGVYIAVQGDGTPWGPIPESIYGFDPGFLEGTSKHPAGHAVCISHFLHEYQRLSYTERTITTSKYGVQRADDMLTWARNCADFINTYMIMGEGQNEPDNLPECDPGIGNMCLYYWGFVNRTGQEHWYAIPASRTTVAYYALADSFVAWTMADLALELHRLGDPAYTTYAQAARAFWEWASAVGPPYSPRDPTPEDPSYEARDQFWAGLGMKLYELSVAEGAPEPALRQEVIDCVNQTGAYAAPYEMRNRCSGTTYTTAYGRSTAHAMELLHRGIDHYDTGRPIWHNFGAREYGEDPNDPQNPFTPFLHGAGREYLAGVQRVHWFYYTFPDRPDPPASELLGRIEVPGSWTVESWSRYAILNYWNYAREHMWDGTPGQEAWWESRAQRYKPCFSLGTPAPIADWKAPGIGDKVHTLNDDGSATVTIQGVEDAWWPHLNWSFRGIGVEQVRVRYSTDGGQNWQTLIASETDPDSGEYVATIPPAPGQTVFYYAEAEDAFGNISTFPAGAPALYQIYTLRQSTFSVAWSVNTRDVNKTLVLTSQDQVELTITGEPTAVTLERLEALRTAEGILVNWQTSDEIDNYGFNIYRSTTPDFREAVKLTPAPILGEGRGRGGASYSFLDRNPPTGPVYYWLEDIDLAGKRTLHGPANARLQSIGDAIYLPIVR